MTTLRRRKLIMLIGLGFILIVFGQNFDLVPRNPLFSPPDENKSLIEGMRMPASIRTSSELLSFSTFKRYFLDAPPDYNAGDMTFRKFSEKGLSKGLENFVSDAQFQNSQMGQTLKSIERRSQKKLTIVGGGATEAITADGTAVSSEAEEATEVALYTSSQRTYVRLKTAALDTTCGYSLLSQTVDLKFQSTYLPFDAVAVDYDPKSTVGQVKMQMNW